MSKEEEHRQMQPVQLPTLLGKDYDWSAEHPNQCIVGKWLFEKRSSNYIRLGRITNDYSLVSHAFPVRDVTYTDMQQNEQYKWIKKDGMYYVEDDS